MDLSASFIFRIKDSSSVNSKPRLTQELTTTFIENFNSRNVSGKALRNKKKPSCLVLDDFCIDYHNTSIESKSEKKRQYLKPKGQAVKQIKENLDDSKTDNENVLSQESENVTALPKDRNDIYDVLKSDEKVDKDIFSNEDISEISSEIPETSQKMNDEQGRYSKRKRSRKPKRYFGSEFDLHLNFDRKAQPQSKVEENKQKEIISLKPSNKINAKSASEQKTKEDKCQGTVVDKKQQNGKASPSVDQDIKSIKRSARIELKRSRKADNELEEVSYLKGTYVMGGKRTKLGESPKYLLTKKEKTCDDKQLKELKQKRTVNIDRSSKAATENEIVGSSNEVRNLIKSCVTPNEHLEKKSIETKNIKTQRSARKTVKSPNKGKSLPKKSPSKILEGGGTGAKESEKSRSQVKEDSDANDEAGTSSEINSDSLLCHEPSLEDNFDHVKYLKEKMAVLRQAEKILGGKIKSLNPEDVVEFQKSSMVKGLARKEIGITNDRGMFNDRPELILVKRAGYYVSDKDQAKKIVFLDLKETGLVEYNDVKSGRKSVKIEVSASKLFKGQNSGHETQTEQVAPSSSSSSTVSKESTEICQVSNKDRNVEKNKKEKDSSVASRIIIDRSKGTVSIQSVIPDREKDGTQAFEDRLQNIGNKGHGASSVFNVLNERTKDVGQHQNDTESSDAGDERTENESDSCIEELCSSETDDNSHFDKETSIDQKVSQPRPGAAAGLTGNDGDDVLSKSSKDVKSIYAELSFKRLLASVHEETVKTHLITSDVGREEERFTKNIDAKAKEIENADNVDKNDVAMSNISELKNEIEDDVIKRCNKQPKKGDLLLLAMQRSYERMKKQKNEIVSADENKMTAGCGTSENSSKELFDAVRNDENVKKYERDGLAKEMELLDPLDEDNAGTKVDQLKASSYLEEEQCVNKDGNDFQQLKKGRILLDALEGLEIEGHATKEEETPESWVLSEGTVLTQESFSNLQIARDPSHKRKETSKSKFVSMPKRKRNSFKSKSATKQRPSVDQTSGLKNIERKMMDLSNEKKGFSKQNSLLAKFDSSQINDFITRLHCKVESDSSSDDQDCSRVGEDDGNDLLRSSQNTTCGEYRSKEEQSKHMKGRLMDEPGSNITFQRDEDLHVMERRRKNVEPNRHIKMLKAHPETHLLSENVKATLLQFDGKKNRSRNECKDDLKEKGAFKESVERERKSSENEAKNTRMYDFDGLTTVYSIGKVRKSYQQSKVGLRKYPIPTRSWRRRKPNMRSLDGVFPRKDDTEVPNCEMMMIKRPSAARDEGEELLKKMLKLNKGILIRQDIKQ